jgi:hypothetical protein
MAKEIPAPLSREIPAKIHDELVKTLVIINGGGAISLLTFLGTTWKDNAHTLIPYIIPSLIIFCIGIVLAALVNLVRASAAIDWETWFLQKDSKALARAETKTKLFRLLSGLSLVCFVCAVLCVVAGAEALTT